MYLSAINFVKEIHEYVYVKDYSVVESILLSPSFIWSLDFSVKEVMSKKE
jgi:hypothetical protein